MKTYNIDAELKDREARMKLIREERTKQESERTREGLDWLNRIRKRLAEAQDAEKEIRAIALDEAYQTVCDLEDELEAALVGLQDDGLVVSQ